MHIRRGKAIVGHHPTSGTANCTQWRSILEIQAYTGFHAFCGLRVTSVLLFISTLVLLSNARNTTVSTFEGYGLNTAAKAAHKLYFGTATDNPELNDTAYVSILKQYKEFGQLTPANSMKWYATEPEPGVFTFEQGDQIADLAKDTGKLLRGHNCVWYSQLPDWINNGTFTAPELKFIVERHCYTLVNHYKSQVNCPISDSWDVINEPFNDNGTFRTDLWYDVLGTSYIPIALRAARAADPHAKLYINDYNIEGAGAKASALKDLVKSLKDQGVPIDGVGVESHLIVGEVPADMQQNLAEFTALGIEVAITELDIRFEALPPSVAGLEQQRSDYETVVAACNAVERCVGVTIWDFTDKYSWIPSAFPGEGDACPWDANLLKKPAYYGIISGFETA
ncbi:Endo-1,4-beta-xylanase A [Grifola frondosa]|uniref:Beta-xylanase n=1 Tax=Grifola frondosa TaxID=5627 RepID=A0A1C7LRW2_GRIFR|nr:Endo-1,4-beta-xylanase A [Grifola frondosa]